MKPICNFEDELNLILEKPEGHIIKIKNEKGNGSILSFSPFHGIILSFCDFNTSIYNPSNIFYKDCFSIDFCLDGRIEEKLQNNYFIYLSKGDTFFCYEDNFCSSKHFPSNHYKGISLIFFLDKSDDGIQSIFPNFQVNIKSLAKKSCNSKINQVLLKNQNLISIFRDMHPVPKDIRLSWFRIKILQLLLFLYSFDFNTPNSNLLLLSKENVSKVKLIHDFMIKDLKSHYTLETLSKKFNIPTTTMKNYFKAVYGDSIYSYMRTYKILKAARLLKQFPEKSIMEIATMMGYQSPGKFSAAFHGILGCSPFSYRKHKN